MSENNNNNDKLLDRDYDGIQEYDNPLPNWWLVTFFGTIIFAFLYYGHYEISGVGASLQDELKLSMQEVRQAQAGASTSPQWSEDSLAEKFKSVDPAAGKAVFAGKCAVCHGEQGGGLIGPNLTDNFWIAGQGSRLDIINVIAKGVLDKGMPNWDAVLSPDELLGVAKYVWDLKGSKPASAKAPQGTEIK